MNVTGYEKLTISNSVKQFTADKYSDVAVGLNTRTDAEEAYVTVEATNSFRWTVDGTAPEVTRLDNYFTGQKENIVHLLENKYFEVVRHDVIQPYYIEVDEI